MAPAPAMIAMVAEAQARSIFDPVSVVGLLHDSLSGIAPLVVAADAVLNMAAEGHEPPSSVPPALLDGLTRVALADDLAASTRGAAALLWLCSMSPRSWIQLVQSGALRDVPGIGAAVTDALLCDAPPSYLQLTHAVTSVDSVLGSRLRALCILSGVYGTFPTPLSAAVSHVVDHKQRDKKPLQVMYRAFRTLDPKCWDAVGADDFAKVIRVLAGASGPEVHQAREILDGESVLRKLCVGFHSGTPAKGRIFAILSASRWASTTRAGEVAVAWFHQDAAASGFKIGNYTERSELRLMAQNICMSSGAVPDVGAEEDGEINEEDGEVREQNEVDDNSDEHITVCVKDEVVSIADSIDVEHVMAYGASGVANLHSISAAESSRGWGLYRTTGGEHHKAVAAYIAAPEAMWSRALELNLSDKVDAAPPELRGPVDDSFDAAVAGVLAHVADVRSALGLSAPTISVTTGDDAEKENAMLKSVQSYEVRLRRLALTHSALVRRRRGALCGGVHACVSSVSPFGVAAVICATVLLKSMRGMRDCNGRNGCVFSAAVAGAEGRREHGVSGRFRELAKAAAGLLLDGSAYGDLDIEMLESVASTRCDCEECASKRL
jgi:hypothetical protein